MRFLFQTFLIISLLHASSSYGQVADKSSLEKQRARLIQDIEMTSTLVKKAKVKSQATLEDFQVVEAQLNKRKALVKVLDAQLNLSKERENILKDSVSLLEKAIQGGQKEYAIMLNKAHVKARMAHPFQYLANGVSIFEGFRKWIYLRQLKQFILRKQETLKLQASNLTARTEALSLVVQQQSTLLADAVKEKKQIVNESSQKKELLDKIKKNMRTLEAKLKEQEAERKRLNDAIEKLILAELEKNRKRRELNTLPEAELSALSKDFKKNKGNLPWPVSKGVVTSKYGKQSHPDLKGVYMDNTGIDLVTDAGGVVKSIFEGSVVGASKIAGHQNMVVVNHGDYYTVYSKLAAITVKPGDHLDIGQTIGTTGNAIDGLGNLHFEIWNGKVKVDPQEWIRRQ